MKFKFEASLDDDFKNTIEFECETIGDVVEHFDLFLRGTGFHQDSINEYLYGDQNAS